MWSQENSNLNPIKQTGSVQVINYKTNPQAIAEIIMTI